MFSLQDSPSLVLSLSFAFRDCLLSLSVSLSVQSFSKLWQVTRPLKVLGAHGSQQNVHDSPRILAGWRLITERHRVNSTSFQHGSLVVVLSTVKADHRAPSPMPCNR